MIFEARNSSRRLTRVSSLANLETKIASSIAESPPPMTITFLSLKKAPSQTPQVETPQPESSISPGTPSRRGSAPIARITVLARYSSSPRRTFWTPPSESSTRSTSSVTKRVAEALGLGAELAHHLRAHDPVGIAGVVLDVGRVLQLPAPLEALEDERLEVGAGGVEGGGVAGRPAADDDHVLCLLLLILSPPRVYLRSIYFTLYSNRLRSTRGGDRSAAPPSSQRWTVLRSWKKATIPAGIGSQKATSR